MSTEPWTVKLRDGAEKLSTIRQGRRNAPAFVNNSSCDESKTFLKDIRVTLFLMKLAALLPMYRKLSNSELGPPTRVRLIYVAIVHILVYSATGFLIYIFYLEGYHQTLFSYTPVNNISYWVELVFWGFSYLVTVFKCSRHLKPAVKILNDIIQLDKVINQRRSANIANECGFAVIYFILIFVCLSYAIIVKTWASLGEATVNTYIAIIIYYLNSWISIIIIVYISVLFRILNVRLIYLNSIISRYNYRGQLGTMRQDIARLDNRQTQESVQSHPPLMQNFPDDSLFAFGAYQKILHIYNDMNDCYSFTIFVYMGYAFFTATTTTYTLFLEIITREGISREAMQLCFAFFIAHTSVMAMLSTCCGQATNQANRTAELLAKVYGNNNQQKNILFIAASIYLIILIQFKQLEESKKIQYESKMFKDMSTTPSNSFD